MFHLMAGTDPGQRLNYIFPSALASVKHDSLGCCSSAGRLAVSAAGRLQQCMRIRATGTSVSSTVCCRRHQQQCHGLASLYSAAVLAAWGHIQKAAYMLLR